MIELDRDRANQIEALAMSNAKAIEALTQSVKTIAEATGRSARAIESLAERVEEDRVNFREFLNRTDTTLASINAALERQDRILDYLMHRDGDGG